MLQAAAVQGTCRRARVESPKTSPIELTPRTTFGHALAWWISWIREKKNALASSVSSIFWSLEFSAYIILLSLGMQLLMAYFEDLSNFGLYHVLWPSVITKKKSWPLVEKKHTLNCNFTWQSQISIDLGRLSIFIFHLKSWVILGELPQSNQPFLVDCRIAGGAHWANHDIRKPFTVSWWSFHGKKMTSKMDPPRLSRKKIFKSKFV